MPSKYFWFSLVSTNYVSLRHISTPSQPHACLAKLGAHLHCFNELRGKHLHYMLIQSPVPRDTITFHNICGPSQPALLLKLYRLIALTILLWAFFHCWDFLVLHTFTSQSILMSGTEIFVKRARLKKFSLYLKKKVMRFEVNSAW